MLRSEYPRPNFKRNSFMCLNGSWDFGFLKSESDFYKEDALNLKINVPFCFESKLSGINDKGRHDLIGYRKTFELKIHKGKRYILNFNGVDYETKVYVNKTYVGHHVGSAARFSFDITDYVIDGSNEIGVFVKDPSYKEDIPRGKQTWEDESRSIWYTRTSGIYKSVWLEEVPNAYLKQVLITPDIDNGEVEFKVKVNQPGSNLNIKILENNEIIKEITTKVYREEDCVKVRIWNDILENAFHNENHLWTPNNPHLYDVILEYGNKDNIDQVTTYFGMRKIEIKNNIVYLNNRNLYQKLVLIQGYFEEGIMTPKNISQLEEDILKAKELGFNGGRMHQKVEDDYFYYYADKLGFLVWCESPNCAKYSKESEILQFNERNEIVAQQYNHPSIIAYTPLNESWGVNEIEHSKDQQNFCNSLFFFVKSLDKTRIVISNDGWEHCYTDLVTFHDYTTDSKSKHFVRFSKGLIDKKYLLKHTFTNHKIFIDSFEWQIKKPFLLSEYGGMALIKSENKGDWGYCVSHNEEEYLNTYKKLQEVINSSKYLCGYCFTQLYDVEQEKNGILTYNRMYKIDANKIKELNDFVEGVSINEE